MSELSPLHVAARDAFLYALPLTEIANVRDRFLGAGLPAGRFFPQRGLATPADRVVTTPNVDTIYANAFIDLRHGPATLTLPPAGPRYLSLSIMDMFSDNVAVLGSRTTGQDGGTFTLAGPTDAAPPGALRSATPWVWCLARVVVNGPSDVDSALTVLHAIVCEGTPAKPIVAPGVSRTGGWEAWMKAASNLMIENPPVATDRRILARMAPLGLGAPDFDARKFSPAEAAEIAAGFAEGQELSRSIGFGGKQIGGWLYPAANTGNFFQDYLTRARIAVSGLAALPVAEAMYLAAVSAETGIFNGDGVWRLHFPAGALPPVDAFWSITMYAAEASGALFLTPNPIDRYAIGDRTPGVVRDADGALDIWITRTDPGGARTSNWLPAPKESPFVPILRAYLPREELISQRYTPPAILRE
jgi:hypothetical protein